MSWAARRWAKTHESVLPRKASVLLFHFADEANDQGQCWRDQFMLARRTGWSRPTIRRWTDFLRALGLISTKKRFNHHKGYCDALIYTVHLDRVVMAEDVERQRKVFSFALPRGKGKLRRGQRKTGDQQPPLPQYECGAASPPRGVAGAGRVAPPPDQKSEIRTDAARASPSPPLRGSGRTHNGISGRHEHEARQVGAVALPVVNGHTAGDAVNKLLHDFERWRSKASLPAEWQELQRVLDDRRRQQ